jgi:hypothetical protein
MQPAQTNLQLLSRMREDGYPPGDLTPVVSAYWLAVEAFGAQVRGTGKPFLCHLATKGVPPALPGRQ